MLWGNSGKSSRSDFQPRVKDLYRATSGSAGLDLCSSTYTVLTPEMGMQVLPTGVYGPLPQNSMGLLLGRSSWTMKRLQIAPGVIDSDFTGEIKIMSCAPNNIVSIPSGQHIAQLIMLHTIPMGQIKNAQPRGGACFGSSDAYWIQNIKETCPFVCWWASRLLPCPGYDKQCCDEHWGACVSFRSGFLGVYAQKWDCWDKEAVVHIHHGILLSH